MIFFKNNNITAEEFINYLPIVKTYKCFTKNQKVLTFVKDMNKIMDKYKIEDGEIEMSTKFSHEKINANRIVVFIPYKHIKENKKLLKDCFNENDIPKVVKDNLTKSIKDINFSNAQLLFGIDEGEKSRRVYFNYIIKNKINLIAYNIEKKVIAKKVYAQLKNHEFKKELEKLIGDDLYTEFLNIFPEELWKRVGVKEDSRIKNYKYSSFYVNLNFEYKLEQFSDKILNFIRQIYKGDNKDLVKWYECYKNNNIVWLSIGRNKFNAIEFTIYMVYNRNIRNFVDEKKIIKLNKYLADLNKLI